MVPDSAPPVWVRTPGVVTWFRIYAGFLCCLYLATIGVSFVFLLVDPAALDMPPVVARFTGAVLLFLGVVLFAASLLPLFLKPRPWVWVYDLVIICIGMTSACTLIASIPLLIFWLQPETKRYFGR